MASGEFRHMDTAAAAEFVEAGAIREDAGFPFGAALEWTDLGLSPGAYLYRVEFRDAGRRRRALSETVRVAWKSTPPAPSDVVLEVAARSVMLSWSGTAVAAEAPRYRVYRRQPPQNVWESATPAPVTLNRLADTGVVPGSPYCYTIRAVQTVEGVEIEGPASEETCGRTPSEEPPPQQPGSGPR